MDIQTTVIIIRRQLTLMDRHIMIRITIIIVSQKLHEFGYNVKKSLKSLFKKTILTLTEILITIIIMILTLMGTHMDMVTILMDMQDIQLMETHTDTVTVEVEAVKDSLHQDLPKVANQPSMNLNMMLLKAV